MHLFAQKIGAANNVPMADKPTRGAGIVPAFGFIEMATRWTGLGGICLIESFNTDAHFCCLVLDILLQLTMRPIGYLLAIFSIQSCLWLIRICANSGFI